MAYNSQEHPNDPTEEEIWGPIDPLTGEHMGGGLADRERANRKERANGVKHILPMEDHVDKIPWWM